MIIKLYIMHPFLFELVAIEGDVFGRNLIGMLAEVS